MKTLVVKIGTSTLVRDGEISQSFIADLARQIARLRAENWRVALVSSGAVRAGLDVLAREKANNLAEKQAAAAVGQSLLMREYRVALLPHQLHVAQILLTRADVADRRRFLNARHTFEQLFAWGVVPVVNENDSVSTEEIRVGDNDTLAALTVLVSQADKVLLLSDVDGFYLPNRSAPEREIGEITPAIWAAAGGAGSAGATGGMKTKLDAARIATDAGIELVIASGRALDVVLRVARGEAIGTRFCAPRRLNARKIVDRARARRRGHLGSQSARARRSGRARREPVAHRHRSHRGRVRGGRPGARARRKRRNRARLVRVFQRRFNAHRGPQIERNWRNSGPRRRHGGGSPR